MGVNRAFGYTLVSIVSALVFFAGLPLLNYVLATSVVGLIMVKDEDSFYYAFIIVLISTLGSVASTEVDVLNSDETLVETISNSINLGPINITLPEIFCITLLTQSFNIRTDKFVSFYKILLVVILIGGIASSYNAFNYHEEKITSWSGGIRCSLVPFSLLAGMFINKNFNGISLVKFLASILITFLVGMVIFNHTGHFVFILAATVGCTIFISIPLFVIMSTLFILVSIYKLNFLTFTTFSTLVIPILLFFGFNSLKRVLTISYIILLFSVVVFAYLWWNMGAILSTTPTEQEFTLDSLASINSYLFYKIGDRISLWLPFSEQIMKNPIEMIFGIPVYVFDPSGSDRVVKWTTHPHNVFIGILKYYGIWFGSIFIFILLKIFYDSLRSLKFVDIAYAKFLIAIVLSMLPGLLFGFFPLESGVGYIYFTVAGVLIFKNEGTSRRIG